MVNPGQQFKLAIDATNNPNAFYVTCVNNPAGLIFAVVTNDCPCASGKYFDSATCICQLCQTGCLSCPNLLTCTTCNKAAGYVLDNALKTCSCNGVGSCSSASVPVCGNGIIEGFEACDDSNIASGDGCDSTCTIEDYFDCSGTTLSTCWLVGPILMSPIDSVINPSHTSANLTFSV